MLSLVFVVDERRYALPCRSLEEVVLRVTLRAMPHAPPFVAGMFVLRGEVVPVIDLSQLIANRPCPDLLSNRIILARLGTGMIGVLAERVLDAVDLTRRVPRGALGGAAYLGELFLDDSDTGSVIQVLELEGLISETRLLPEGPA